MGKKRQSKKHVSSEKFVSNNIDKNWIYDNETQKFSHPVYPNKSFQPLCKNRIIEDKRTFKDKYGKKHTKINKKMVSEMFPCVSPEEDNRNMGFTIGTSHSAYTFEIVPNKMQSFWDTRRGKRYISYIAYRKQRDTNRQSWVEETSVEVTN
mgnify:CR=1 FL=1